VSTGNDARGRILFDHLDDKMAHVGAIRALGFCVSVEHTCCMAEPFVVVGIPARAPQLLQEHRRALGGPQEQHGVDLRDVEPLVKQVYREDDVCLPVAQRISAACRSKADVSADTRPGSIPATNMIAG
jgi:hypothetical protein